MITVRLFDVPQNSWSRNVTLLSCSRTYDSLDVASNICIIPRIATPTTLRRTAFQPWFAPTQTNPQRLHKLNIVEMQRNRTIAPRVKTKGFLRRTICRLSERMLRIMIGEKHNNNNSAVRTSREILTQSEALSIPHLAPYTYARLEIDVVNMHVCPNIREIHVQKGGLKAIYLV